MRPLIMAFKPMLVKPSIPGEKLPVLSYQLMITYKHQIWTKIFAVFLWFSQLSHIITWVIYDDRVQRTRKNIFEFRMRNFKSRGAVRHGTNSLAFFVYVNISLNPIYSLEISLI